MVRNENVSTVDGLAFCGDRPIFVWSHTQTIGVSIVSK